MCEDDAGNIDRDVLEVLRDMPGDLDSETPPPLGSDYGNNFTCADRVAMKRKVKEQGQLWKSQTIHKNTVAAKLREAGELELALELEDCHSYMTVQVCTGCQGASKFWNRCDRFYCPECQARLSKMRVSAVEWWAKTIKQPKHIVLTTKNMGTFRREDVKAFKCAFSRLRRMAVFKGVRGGFYNLEVTNEGKGWHLHLHALVDCDYLSQKDLSEAWRKATRGNGYIVRVYDAREKSYLKEVTKYAVKGSQLASWTGEEISDFIHALDGVRTFGVFGSCFGRRAEYKAELEKMRDGARTCECGCQKFRYLSEEDYEIELSERAKNAPRPKEPPPPPPTEFAFAEHLTRRNLLSRH